MTTPKVNFNWEVRIVEIVTVISFVISTYVVFNSRLTSLENEVIQQTKWIESHEKFVQAQIETFNDLRRLLVKELSVLREANEDAHRNEKDRSR